MSVVVNMHQRRTIANGRQNQDPNTAVGVKDLTPKKTCPKLEKSIQEVLNHARNTSGRGRAMVLAALQKKAQASDEKKSPQSASKASQSGKQPHSTPNRNEVGTRCGYGSSTPSKGGENTVVRDNSKLSLSAMKRRPMDSGEQREPLSDLGTSATDRQVLDWADWTDMPNKITQKEETIVYKKRPRVEVSHKVDPLSLDVSDTENLSAPSNSCETSTWDCPKEGVNKGHLQSVRWQLETSPGRKVHRMFGEGRWIPEQTPFTNTTSWADESGQHLLHECRNSVPIQLAQLFSDVERLSRTYLEQDSESCAVEKDLEMPSLSGKLTVTAALLQVFHDMKVTERKETVNPIVLKRSFAKFQSSFWGCIQQDAHEFFCSLIGRIQEEVSSLVSKHLSRQVHCPEVESICPTTQNFSCTVRNSLTCVDCNNLSQVEEPYLHFSLALPEEERNEDSKASDLESLLRLYFQETAMSRKCEKCGGESAKVQARILRLPRVLVFHLKRLLMDRDVPCTKRSVPVNFSPHLDIGPWCSNEAQSPLTPMITSFSHDSMDNSSSASVPSSHQCLSHPVCKSNGVVGKPISDGKALSSKITGERDVHLHRAIGTSSLKKLPKEWSNAKKEETLEIKKGHVSTCYRLQGIVSHLGGQASGGHYVANIHDTAANRWLRCDDALVTEVPAEVVFNDVEESYMFIYVHEPLSAVP